MDDGRLSDMAILAIEREIIVDLDRTVEQFSRNILTVEFYYCERRFFCFYGCKYTFKLEAYIIHSINQNERANKI